MICILQDFGLYKKEKIMKEKLTVLFNTLAQIETKGDGTLKMAGCLQHLQQMIAECEMQDKTPKPTPKPIESETETVAEEVQ